MNVSTKRLLSVLAAVAPMLAPVCASLNALTPTTVVTGLSTPTKTTMTSEGTLVVAEAGSSANTGRISLVDPATGDRRTLLDGLPSGPAAPNLEPSGPSGLLLQGRTLYVTIGSGDGVINGPAPTTFLANPRPSSPLLASLLAIHFGANVDRTTRGPTLSPADHVALKAGTRIVRDNGAGDTVTIELFADFDDYVADPRPTLSANVRAANPFGLAALGERLFVVDASLNSIRTVDRNTRAIGTLITFAPIPNTRGMGPPVVEAVPDSIRVYGNQLLVTMLTGFPFPLGGAQVQQVDPTTGASVPFITGLTSAIDVLPLNGGGFLTLEHTADMLAGATAGPSGRLQWFAAPNASPVVVHNTFSTPTRLEIDERSGSIYITEIFAGRIVKVSPWSVASALTPGAPSQLSNVAVRGNAGTGNDTLIAGFNIDTTTKQVLVRGVGPRLLSLGVAGALVDPRISIFDSAGRLIAENDNWTSTGDADTALLGTAAAKVGAFPLVAGSRDAALLRTLPAGAYTVHVSGVGGTSGISLLEVYSVP